MSARVKNLMCKTCGQEFPYPTKEEVDYAWEMCFRKGCGLNEVNSDKLPSLPKNGGVVRFTNKDPAWLDLGTDEGDIAVYFEEPMIGSVGGKPISNVSPIR